MQTSSITLTLLLCMSLFSAIVSAEMISIPDQEDRKGMSYEEYSKYREKMRMQMENSKPEKDGQQTRATDNDTDTAGKPEKGSKFGQGYDSRNLSAEMPDSIAHDRPERPRRIERPQRGDMGRR
jgi:hypothetical protein